MSKEHDDEEKALGDLTASVRQWLNRGSPSYVESRDRVLLLLAAVKEESARAVEQPLNQHLAQVPPQVTYEGKKLLARWVNAELREMGLAIREGGSGRPSVLQANPGVTHPAIGRFRLDFIDDDGIHHQATTVVTLPHLELMPNSEPFPRYRRRSGPSR